MVLNSLSFCLSVKLLISPSYLKEILAWYSIWAVSGQFVEFSLLWSFLAVGGFVWVACQSFLVREACVSVPVGGAGFLLSGVQ